MPKPRICFVSDTSLLVEFENLIDPAVNEQVTGLATAVRSGFNIGITDIVPTFRSLLIEFEPLVVDGDDIIDFVNKFFGAGVTEYQTKMLWRIPVCYDPSVACDLARVAHTFRGDATTVANIHSSIIYRVFMLGFLPGQPYLGKVCPELSLPRLASPRPFVDAGSVGIANGMTTIFPVGTPSGWHIIGRCPSKFFDLLSDRFLRSGDHVQFVPISLSKYYASMDELLAAPSVYQSDIPRAA